MAAAPDHPLRRASDFSDTGLHERVATLEARIAECDRNLTDIVASLEQHAKDELERLGKVYEAINGLRQDLWMAKGGGRAVIAIGGVLVVMIGAAWSVFQYLHPRG